MVCGITFDLLIVLQNFHNVSKTKVDFPPPDTPVTHVKVPKETLHQYS